MGLSRLRFGSLRLRLVAVFAAVALTAAVSASGIAYWLKNLAPGVTSAILFDYDSLERTGVTPSVPRTTNYEIKTLINF